MPFTFTPYLGWVNVQDQNNPPPGARKIAAEDLLRYENAFVSIEQELAALPGTYRTAAQVNTAVNSAVSAHEGDTTDVHGIGDTSTLVVTSDSRLSDERTPVNGSVTTAKVANDAITNAKIGPAAVDTTELANGAVTLAKTSSALQDPAAGTAGLRSLGNGSQQAASGDHDHDTDYSALGHNHDGDYSALGHNHDGRYYTEAEADAAFQPVGDYATLVGGVIPTSQIPAIATNEFYVVANETELLALDVQRGDVALRTDQGTRYILGDDDPSVLANWVTFGGGGGGSGAVDSVNGQTGIVVLSAADVNAAPTSHTHSGYATTGHDHDGDYATPAQLTAHTGNTSNPHSVTAAQAGAVPTSRQITAGAGLSGGGALTANRALAVAFGTSAGTVTEGNDSRLSDARTPTAHTHDDRYYTEGQVDTALAGKVNALTAGASLQFLTQAEYDAIGSPSSTTLYVITD